MPRVMINKKQYRIECLGSWIVGLFFRKKKKRKDLAEELGVSVHGLNWKLRNNSFTFGDMLTIFEFFECTDEEILQVMKLRGA